MKHVALIIIIVLSLFIVGCAKHAPATKDNVSTTPAVIEQTPVAQPSNNNMPPPPPAEPSPGTG